MPHDSHWQHWHEQYAEADSALNRRLSIVRAHIVHWLEHRPPGEGRRILSLCAGDGRDVLGVLGQRPSDARLQARRSSASIVVRISSRSRRASRSSTGVKASIRRSRLRSSVVRRMIGQARS